MKLSRDFSLKIHYIFDQLVPPILRDCRWFMYLPIKIAFRHNAKYYFNFKQKAHELSNEEYDHIYNMVHDVMFERPTDLNRKSIELISQHIKGNKVLEVGCGEGFLSETLSKNYDLTAVDINIPNRPDSKVKYLSANIENLPFSDKEFDTVICTHTLEHVLHLQKAIDELRRVAKCLILVVPRQRPYKYTFDLHINFFPYNFSLLNVMKPKPGKYICLDAAGDIFYSENNEQIN